MARTALLEMVQDVLMRAGQDLVNEIDSTEDSNRVVTFIKNTWEDILNMTDHAAIKDVGQLEASGDVDLPCVMYIPDSWQRLVWEKEGGYLRYNKIRSGETRNRYRPVRFMELEEFFSMVFGRDNDDSNTDVMTLDGEKYHIRTNLAPSYWTQIGDRTIVFDSFDNTVDTTLQSSKTEVQYFRSPSFTTSDTFDFSPLPVDYIPLIRNLAYALYTGDQGAAAIYRQIKFKTYRDTEQAKPVQRANYGRNR